MIMIGLKETATGMEPRFPAHFDLCLSSATFPP
jgi:hypothetical protein